MTLALARHLVSDTGLLCGTGTGCLVIACVFGDSGDSTVLTRRQITFISHCKEGETRSEPNKTLTAASSSLEVVLWGKQRELHLKTLVLIQLLMCEVT